MTNEAFQRVKWSFPMMTEDGYVRHTLTLLFDIPPAKIEAQPEIARETLNLLANRIFDLINADKEIARRLRMLDIDWGWDTPSWERKEE